MSYDDHGQYVCDHCGAIYSVFDHVGYITFGDDESGICEDCAAEQIEALIAHVEKMARFISAIETTLSEVSLGYPNIERKSK